MLEVTFTASCNQKAAMPLIAPTSSCRQIHESKAICSISSSSLLSAVLICVLNIYCLIDCLNTIGPRDLEGTRPTGPMGRLRLCRARNIGDSRGPCLTLRIAMRRRMNNASVPSEQRGATENARHENAAPCCRGGKCGKS